MVLVPHFDLPFRLSGSSSVEVVEQNSIEDISNCIEAALRTEKGSRMDIATFGITELVFAQMPIDTQKVIAEITTHEDRAQLVLIEEPNAIDSMIDNIRTEVAAREGASA